MPESAITPVEPVEPVNVVDAGRLGQTPSVQEAVVEPLADYSAFVKSFQTDNTDLTDQQDQLSSSIRGNLDAHADAVRSATEMEAKYNVPQQYDRLEELNLQIADLTGSFDTAIQAEEGEVRPIEFITGRQAFLQNQKATQVGALAAVQAALQNNIALAEQRVDRTVQREFQALEAELAADEFEYTENKDELERRDKKAADALAQGLEERRRVLDQRKDERKAVMDLAIEAAQNGAPNAVVSRIAQSGNRETALGLAGEYVGRLSRLQAEASIASSWASAAASNTSRLLSLAEAGDPRAIKELNFDPRKIEVEVDPTTKRQLSDKIASGEQLLKLTSQYRDLVDRHGFENTLVGDQDVAGKYQSLRAQITAAYKDAKTLGTLDAGLLTLMEGIIGEEPTSGLKFMKNASGNRSERIVAQLDELIEATSNETAKAKLRLGIDPTQLDFSVITPDEDAAIDAEFGATSGSTSAPTFDPARYYSNP